MTLQNQIESLQAELLRLLKVRGRLTPEVSTLVATLDDKGCDEWIDDIYESDDEYFSPD